MHNKHKQTLKAVFADPARSNIQWSDVETMLLGLGAEVSEGNGSRVRIYLNGVRQFFIVHTLRKKWIKAQ